MYTDSKEELNKVYEAMQCIIEHNNELWHEVQELRSEFDKMKKQKYDHAKARLKYELNSLMMMQHTYSTVTVVGCVYSINDNDDDLTGHVKLMFFGRKGALEARWSTSDYVTPILFDTWNKASTSERTTWSTTSDFIKSNVSDGKFVYDQVVDGNKWKLIKVIRAFKVHSNDQLQYDVVWDRSLN
jgi:hypothetical protein